MVNNNHGIHVLASQLYSLKVFYIAIISTACLNEPSVAYAMNSATQQYFKKLPIDITWCHQELNQGPCAPMYSFWKVIECYFQVCTCPPTMTQYQLCNSKQILHGQRENMAQYFTEVLITSLMIVSSSEGKYAIFSRQNHVVFVLLHEP